jgi:hypothetical protein
MNGTADTLSIYTIRLAPSETSASERFSQSWIAARRHYPLLGARVEESADREASFVIDEEALGQLHEDNFVFQDISSEREVDVTVELHLNNVRKLSQTILSKCIIMRRTDEPNMYHVLFQVAHLITDGMANYSLARMFFNTLASSSPFSVIPDLQSRLRAVPSQESIMPVYAMSRPRQRWRRAIAFALWQGYQRKMTGGHTIPNRITPETLWTPARSCAIHVRLPEHVSARISRTCRVNGITVGHAHPLLAQLAMSRVLHRRYARGEISQEDWERRLREPTHTGGPLNLRPFLAGRDGALNEEFNVCITNYATHVVPLLTTLSALYQLLLRDDAVHAWSLVRRSRRDRCSGFRRHSQPTAVLPPRKGCQATGLQLYAASPVPGDDSSTQSQPRCTRAGQLSPVEGDAGGQADRRIDRSLHVHDSQWRADLPEWRV